MMLNESNLTVHRNRRSKRRCRPSQSFPFPVKSIPSFAMGLALLVLAILFLWMEAPKVQGAEQIHKAYISHTVEKGDTLWDLAGIHMDKVHYTRYSYMREVSAINGLEGGKIYAGQTLTLPMLMEGEGKREGFHP
ncbi:LysM peptidoglycan-binding domain-containing protein [Anaerotalea alkaliphila]|uniref:LysM peptidoglycan-binding domain-containing protein n=1 Tax=Anaerotalea alkaliphila TaxID=2662126 RepID=A0A7X5HWJ1_9FIRM|nr:LysM peptidoglycan-binding domain-containing protein [Anaerotalea alkaliphila]NDL67927.1 LysM peptidoglycan-binding domain-containing protein [Anaerotalea alkaliphila]